MEVDGGRATDATPLTATLVVVGTVAAELVTITETGLPVTTAVDVTAATMGSATLLASTGGAAAMTVGTAAVTVVVATFVEVREATIAAAGVSEAVDCLSIEVSSAPYDPWRVSTFCVDCAALTVTVLEVSMVELLTCVAGGACCCVAAVVS